MSYHQLHQKRHNICKYFSLRSLKIIWNTKITSRILSKYSKHHLDAISQLFSISRVLYGNILKILPSKFVQNCTWEGFTQDLHRKNTKYWPNIIFPENFFRAKNQKSGSDKSFVLTFFSSFEHFWAIKWRFKKALGFWIDHWKIAKNSNITYTGRNHLIN